MGEIAIRFYEHEAQVIFEGPSLPDIFKKMAEFLEEHGNLMVWGVNLWHDDEWFVRMFVS